jgi:DNA ligase-4
VPFTLSIPELDVKFDQGQLLRPTDPFVVEIMGAGFAKPANARHFALRFPRVQKIHQDRTFRDAVSFDELQELARQSREVAEGNESQEDRFWFEKLQRADPISDYVSDRSTSSTPSDDQDVRTAETRIDSPEPSDRQSARALDDISIHSSKRKLTSEIFPQSRYHLLPQRIWTRSRCRIRLTATSRSCRFNHLCHINPT